MTTPYLLIQKKRDGGALSGDEIRQFVSGYVREDIPDYQMAAFLMAVFFRGMTPVETAGLTQAMMDSGDRLDPSELGHPTADKHSTGGVGDKISIILAPLVAAAGVRVPMMSGRGLGHTGGTLDKLESIPGFNTRLEKDVMIRQIDRIGVAMIGQTDRMVPADKRMYSLRDVTATVDCIPLIAASIMSKKIAAGPQNLVLDVKVGRGAFMKSMPDAIRLAETMIQIGSAHGRNVCALLTDMDTQPLGRAVGNSLEIIESIEVLLGGGPSDLRELTIELSIPMLEMGGVSPNPAAARATLEHLLDSGIAYQKFIELVEAQGGDPHSVESPFSLPVSSMRTFITADRAGFIESVNPMTIGLAAVELGAGRIRKEDPVDPGVGLMIEARRGDWVNPGDTLAEVYINRPLEPSLGARIQSAFQLCPDQPEPKSVILHTIAPI